jgi:hypothetical protein
MSDWMAYLYEQCQKPTNATGVPVVLSAVDPNGNYQTIGTTTSDIYGQYTMTYALPVPGTYRILATFTGSHSYFASSAETTVAIAEPAATATPMPTQAPSAADLYFVPAIIGVVIAILIVGAVLALLVTKKP